jgi:hypothetical protein
MCTAECIAWIVSRLEEELGNDMDEEATKEVHTNGKAFQCEDNNLYQILMKPLDAMVEMWKAFVSTPKNRKHDLERGLSKKEKRKRRQQHQEREGQQQQQQTQPM